MRKSQERRSVLPRLSDALSFLRGIRSSAAMSMHDRVGCEALEQRQHLSADITVETVLPDGFAMLDWNGVDVPVRSGSYVVTFDNWIGREQADLLTREAMTRLGAENVDTTVYGLGRSVNVKTPSNITGEAVRQILGTIPNLVSIEPDVLYQVNRLPNDARFPDQYSLRNVGQAIAGQLGTAGADINIVSAWDISIGSRDVIVGVIDTGVDLQHPDLIANLWRNPNEIPNNGIDDDGNGYVDDVNGFDFADFDSNPDEEPTGGHGTQVASTLGATGNNGIGVTGVNWNVSIMALKIADRTGQLSTNAIIAAHDYATLMIQRGTNLVATNNSYGAFLPSFYAEEFAGFIAERQAIERFVATGASFVVAAGNEAADNDNPDPNLPRSYPAAYNIPGSIAVAATDNNDALAGFSSYGVQTVDVAAPGQDILVAQDGGLYGFTSGTSFSAPIVAGVIALIKSVKPNASAVEIREALINGSDPLPSLQGKVRSGGRINVQRTLDIITRTGPAVRAITPGPVVGQVNPTTGQPFNTVTITFSKDIDPAFLSAGGVSLLGSNGDNIFGNGNDRTIPVTTIVRSTTDPKTVIVGLNLSGFSGARLPIDNYRLVLTAGNFRDFDGKYLNGDNNAGVNETYFFRVASTTGDNETNDTLATATSLVFDSNGSAGFTGVTLGNGLAGNLDVDMYRIDIPRGGLITAEIRAKRLQNPSTLDSVIRLFNANGDQIAINDNFFAQDSFIDFFVSTGGTYYLGVSGLGNSNYDPRVISSGTSQSLGTYNVSVKVQLANDDIVLVNSTDPNLPRRIPVDEGATQGTSTSFLDVTDSRQILDVDLRLNINHTFVGDLVISLIAPNNAEAIMVNRRGGSGDNFTNTLFDDEAPTAITAGVAPFNASYRPEQFLGLFDGLSGAGRWTLKIVDTTGLNSGFLTGWSLQFTFQNDIFGPFESNDTLATAKDIPQLSGSGAATVNAFLGDGGFGTLDRDIFRFRADAGSSMTASVISLAPANAGVGALPTFNSAMRLFDEAGVEIRLSTSATSLNTTIDNYVFANGGIYYLAISESNNLTYNPTIVGDATGNPALTTGNYSLTVTLAAGVSDPTQVLTGNQISAGMNTGAGFGGTNASGNDVTLNFNGIEFLNSNRAAQYFNGAIAAGYSSTNTGLFEQSNYESPYSLTNNSDAFNQRVSAKSVFRGLSIERVATFGINDSFMAIDVYFRNTTTALLTGVAWMEGFNPDQGIALGENNNQTSNDLSADGKYARAGYVNNQFGQGLSMGLAAPSSDARAKVNFISGSTVVRDPQQLISTPSFDPNGANADLKMVISYDLGDIPSGGTASIRYFLYFGNTAASVDALNTALNDGTGTGHLTADSSSPATEILQTGGSEAVSVPTLPFRVYYPEGFYGDNIFTFLPIGNANDQATRVVVIARYEQGTRDQLVGELTIPANSRSGFTLVTPDLFANGTALAGRPSSNGVVQSYALEIRAERPVSATFSHYDLNQAGGARVAIGESFTTEVSNTWSFGSVSKGAGHSDFLLFFNTTDSTQKVTVNFYPVGGGTVYTEEFRTTNPDGTKAEGLEGYRRGGLSINDIGFLPDGEYGVTISSPVPIVAALSRFDSDSRTADGMVGNVGLGSTTGVTPEGQFSLNSLTESIGVLNAGSTAAAVTFTFAFNNGSAYRTLVNVPPNAHNVLNVETLPNFPRGLPYSVSYDSNVPVTVSDNSPAFNDGVSSSFAQQSYTMWGFAEGFRPGDSDVHPGVVEYLRLYNPSSTDVTVEITISYDGTPGSETFRRTLPARRMSEFDMDQFITGNRRLQSSWFTTTVKGAEPVVAYMGHFDRSFPGAFGTLGTPMGISSAAS